MKAIIRPVCARCGYTYEPKKEIRVLVFQNNDGDYIACEKCIEALGILRESGAPDEEVDAFIKSFKS